MASIHYYHYDKDEDNHELKFHKMSSEGYYPLYLGIELEVDKGGYSDSEATGFYDCFGTVDNDREFVVFENDGSIDNGFEIITNPATLSFHRSLRENYQNGFKRLVKDGYRSYNTSTCGMHIHVNRDYFEDEDIEVLLSVFDKFWPEIEKFSRRTRSDLARWAKKIEKSPKEIIEIMNDDKYYLDRYSAINLQNDSTIEFRLFKGTLNPVSFFAALEFVNNVCVWSVTHNICQLDNARFEDFLQSDEIKMFWERIKNRSVY